MAEAELILNNVTEDEYETAGSKFVTFPPGAKEGDIEYRYAEVGMVGWDTPGKSVKFPITITEDGPDKGKEDKLSSGVDAKGIWKTKEIHRNIVGGDLEMKRGSDNKNHPVIKPGQYTGKTVIAQYTMQSGKKGGREDGEKIVYPKLVALLPNGDKPKVESIM